MWASIIALLISTNDVHTDISSTIAISDKVHNCQTIETTASVKELLNCDTSKSN